ERKEDFEKAKVAKDAAIDDMDESSQTVVQIAYEDLKNGEITGAEFNDVLSIFKRINGEKLSEEDLQEEVPPFVDQYLHDKRVKLSADLGIPTLASAMENTGMGTLRIGGLINTIKST